MRNETTTKQILTIFVGLGFALATYLRGEQPAHRNPVRQVVDAQCESFLQEMVEKERFSGVALAMSKNKIMHAKGYGKASNGKKNKVDTVFHVASITKQFTAVAVLQLVESKKIGLDHPINRYLPKKYRSPKWTKVSVQHLLSHTSGIPDYAVKRDYYEVVDGFCLGETVDGMIREAMKKKLLFKPGSRFKYSNIGFTLLGKIIEQVTCRKYEEYLLAKVLKPVGMTSSRIHVIGHIPASNEASGHRWDMRTQKHVPDDIVSLPVTAPDGGLTTTLSDFVSWARVYMDGNPVVISKEHLGRITTPQIAIRKDDAKSKPRGYGFGLFVSNGLLSHPGSIVGFKSHFILDQKNDKLIVVFSNNTTNNPSRIASGLLKIVN